MALSRGVKEGSSKSKKQAGARPPSSSGPDFSGSNGAVFACDWVNDMADVSSRDKEAKAKAKEVLEPV